jgi:hypothetical protein
MSTVFVEGYTLAFFVSGFFARLSGLIFTQQLCTSSCGWINLNLDQSLILGKLKRWKTNRKSKVKGPRKNGNI